jgi:hypothetical protein
MDQGRRSRCGRLVSSERTKRSASQLRQRMESFWHSICRFADKWSKPKRAFDLLNRITHIAGLIVVTCWLLGDVIKQLEVLWKWLSFR